MNEEVHLFERLEKIKMDICTDPRKIKAMDIVWLVELAEELLERGDYEETDN